MAMDNQGRRSNHRATGIRRTLRCSNTRSLSISSLFSLSPRAPKSRSGPRGSQPSQWLLRLCILTACPSRVRALSTCMCLCQSLSFSRHLRATPTLCRMLNHTPSPMRSHMLNLTRCNLSLNLSLSLGLSLNHNSKSSSNEPSREHKSNLKKNLSSRSSRHPHSRDHPLLSQLGANRSSLTKTNKDNSLKNPNKRMIGV